MKKLSRIFTVLALILSHLMCITVAWDYRDMLCGVEHSCYSAPPEMAFLEIIPFIVGILISVILSYICRKKAK